MRTSRASNQTRSLRDAFGNARILSNLSAAGPFDGWPVASKGNQQVCLTKVYHHSNPLPLDELHSTDNGGRSFAIGFVFTNQPGAPVSIICKKTSRPWGTYQRKHTFYRKTNKRPQETQRPFCSPGTGQAGKKSTTTCSGRAVRSPELRNYLTATQCSWVSQCLQRQSYFLLFVFFCYPINNKNKTLLPIAGMEKYLPIVRIQVWKERNGRPASVPAVEHYAVLSIRSVGMSNRKRIFSVAKIHPGRLGGRIRYLGRSLGRFN